MQKNSTCTGDNQNSDDCQLIVLTGGPGAGKTAVLEYVKKVMCKHTVILPESASLIFKGGFWRLDSLNSKKAVQRAIYHIQSELESLVKGENTWNAGLCDRGTLDGLAYWPESEERFWQSFNSSKNKEYSRYKAIIHLRTPDTDHGYNQQNPFRTETSEQAQAIDEKIHAIWRDHPGYSIVSSTDHFLVKVQNTFTEINKHLPNCCSLN